ncbi:hypothetical protein SAMN04488132_103345 [Sediminibacterium ginsengisoli]|uniref:Uncharacterized protein n=1 Tax=Sediminibacterium ginsengisoli TaxID=413434 RepID=A0A1T4MEH1_9BACT|nr:hypothetical protein SAMN04488132_103345 [Sediminibacterium ginsengisoli]
MIKQPEQKPYSSNVEQYRENDKLFSYRTYY